MRRGLWAVRGTVEYHGGCKVSGGDCGLKGGDFGRSGGTWAVMTWLKTK